MTDNPWIEVLTDDQAPSESRRQVIEEMRAFLRGEDKESCDRALWTVAHVGMEAVELRDDLVRLWRAPNRVLHLRGLVAALGRIREVPILIEALRDVEHARLFRRNVPVALRGIGPDAAAAAPALVETFRDDDKRQEAIQAISAIGAAATPALVAGLSDPSGSLRSRALRCLGFIGLAARDALPAVVRALDDAEAKVRTQAVFALCRLGPLPEPVFARLVKCLADEDREVRRELLWALRERGPDAAAATPALVEMLKTDDAYEARYVLEALAAIGPGAGAAAASLRNSLDAEDGLVRVAAAVAIWRVSADVVTAVAAMIRAAGDSGSKVRCAAVTALGEMGDDAGEAARVVTAALADSNSDVRAAAALAAPHLRAASAAIIPALMQLLDDPAGEPRWYGIQSLLRMGCADKRVGESIRQAMKHGAWDSGPSSWDDGRCLEALDLIRALGPKAGALVPTLEHLRDQYPELRAKALFALAHVRGNIEAAIPELIAALADTNPRRQQAADCLGEIGPAARDAVPHLARMARHSSNSYDRLAAVRALKRIDPGAIAQLRKSLS